MSYRTFNNILAVLATLALLMLFAASASGQIPEKAYAYREAIHSEVLRVWGLHIPNDAYAVAAGTIHQESAWNPRAQSPYAKGLTQFTPGTWEDMRRLDPSISADIWDPLAAIRAMTVYHKLLWGQLSDTPTANLNRWAFVLSSYNGGYSWVRRDQALCKTPCNPGLWFNNVELKSGRAAWAFKENRGYPRNILLRWVPIYRGF
jgi:soluble lytic murein transglycosylase-like protein